MLIFLNILDEQYTKEILDTMTSDSNNYYLLFTNKAESLPYLIDRGHIFSVKQSQIFDFSNVRKIIKYTLGSLNEKYTFDEYLINEGLLVLNTEVEEAIDIISNHGIINFGRMLVNECYSLYGDTNMTKIYPTNEYEKKFLVFIDEILKSSSETTR
jgi:hypothetical protein